jgi:hypothetical protein
VTVPQNQIFALNYYTTAKGIPIGGAIALVSVLYYESKLNPGSQGYQPSETGGILNPHGAYGIASWNGPRQDNLLKFATEKGKAVSALDTQLDFVLTEIANGYPASWSAIRSSASYRTVIPILVDEYENPKDKGKEIAGATAIGGPLAALPPPQPGPSAPLPQVPVPQVPPPTSPLPAPFPEPPPISTTEASWDASFHKSIGAFRDLLVAERARIDARIAFIDKTVEDFGELVALPAPPALQLPATISPRSKTVFAITNWKTTFGGIAAILTAGGAGLHALQSGDLSAAYASIPAIIAGFALISAKDSNVTGGTVPATNEAKRRVGA